MTPLDAIWHLLGALAAPFGLALTSVLLARLLFLAPARHHSWARLVLSTSAAASLAHVGAWWWTGEEGSMAGYALMVGATALVLWAQTFNRSG